MKRFLPSIFCGISLLLLGSRAWGQVTVTYDQQTTNYYTTFTDGTAGVFNQGSFQMGMFANTSGAKQVVAWRKFRTDASGLSTGNRPLRTGDRFIITLSATRAFGRIGFALLAAPTATTSYADRENNYAISFNLDGPLYLGGSSYGNWYAKFNGGTTSAGSANISGQQTTYKNFTFILTLTAPDRMNATWTDGTTTSNLYDIQLNTSAQITDYAVFLEDDWDGGAQRNVFWGLGASNQQHSLTSSGAVNFGLSNTSFVIGTRIPNGLEANNTSNTVINTFTKSGTGTVTLGIDNQSYTGGTIVTDGILQLGGSDYIANAAPLSVTGGTFRLNDFNETVGATTGASAGTISLGSGRLTTSFTGTATLASNITGSGGISKASTGTLILSGAKDYTGPTIINNNGGIIQISNDRNLGAEPGSPTPGNIVLGNTVNTGAATLEPTTSLVLSANRGITLNVNNSTISVPTGVTMEYNGIMAGNALTFIKTAAGKLILGGANTYTGATSLTVAGSILNIRNSSALGTADGTALTGTTIASGTAIEMEGGIAVGNERLIVNGTGISATGALRNISGNNSWAGEVRLGSATTIGSTAGTLTLSGPIGSNNMTAQPLTVIGAGNVVVEGIITNLTSTLTKSAGTGTLFLNNGNSYTGATTIFNGAISFNNNTAFSGGVINLGGGGAVSPTLIPAGGDRAIDNNIVLSTNSVAATPAIISGSNNLTVNGTLTGSGGPRAISSTNTGLTSFAGNVFLSDDNSTTGRGLTLLGDGSTLLSGVVANNNVGNTEASSLTYSGTGSLTLSNANTYSGTTTLNSGTLNISNVQALGTGGFTIWGGTINNTSGGEITLSNNNLQTWNGGFAFTGTNDLNLGTGAVTLGGVATSARTITVSGGTLTVGGGIGPGGSATGIRKAGAGILVLTGASTYAPNTFIDAGILRIAGANDRLPIGTALDFAIAAGATFDLNGFNQQIGSLLGGGTTGGLVQLGSGTLTIGGSTNTSFGGNISGGGGLTRQGTGNQTLTGNNSYTGTTNINGGTLTFNSNTAMSSSSAISLGGGTLAIGTAPTALSATTLSMSPNSTINLGTGSNAFNLVFTGVGATFTGTLTISNWSGLAGKEIILPGLTVGQLANINFTGYGTGAKYDAAVSGRIIPANVYETVTSGLGDFTNPASWTNGVPPSGLCNIATTPTIIIRGTFRLLQNVNINLARIENNGYYQSNNFTTTLCNGGAVVNNGSIDFSGTNATLICDGTATFSGTAAPSGYRLENLTLNNVTTFATAPTIHRTLQLNTGSSIATNSPFYAGSSSTIFYNAPTYNRGLEWATGVTSFSIAGYPGNVTVGSATQACAFNAVNNGTLQMGGTLTIGAAAGSPSSSFTLNENSANVRPLTVLGNILINATGTLTLGTFFAPNAGDLYFAGDFITNSGTFTHNNRALFITGGDVQSLSGNFSGTGATNCLPFLLIDKPASYVSLFTAVNVTNTLTLTNGIIRIATANNLTITSGNPIVGSGFSSSKMIVTNSTGFLQFGADATGTYFFPIGEIAGTTEYSPITINITASTGSSRTLGMRVNDNPVPNPPLNTPTAPTAHISRRWVANSSGFTDVTWTGTATYISTADEVGTPTDMRLSVWRPAPDNIWQDLGGTPTTPPNLNGTVGISGANTLNSNGFITGRSVTPTSLYYRSITNGNWSSPGTWEAATDAGFTNIIAPTPTYPSALNSLGISLRSPHSITIDVDASLDQCVVASGAVLTKGNVNLTINDGTGTDFEILNGGIFRHSGDPMTTINGQGLVRTGGMIEVTTNSSGANAYAGANMDYETDAVFYWNVNSPFGAGTTFFPSATGSIPIFRCGAIGLDIGSSSNTIINGVFDAVGGVSWDNTGTKTFRNGITGSGSVTQLANSGAFQISGTNSVLGGSGTINLNTAGLQITGGTCTMQTDKPIAATSGVGTFTVQSGATLNAQNFALTGSGLYTQASGGTLVTANSSGVNGSITSTGTKIFTAGSNYSFNGTVNQATGSFMPTTVGALTIANTGIASNNRVTLTTNNTTVSTLNLNSGQFACGTGQTLRLPDGGTINGNGANQPDDDISGNIHFLAGGSVNANVATQPQLYNVVVGSGGSTNGGVNFRGTGSSNATILNSLTLNSQGYVNTNAPFYNTGSTLFYNSGASYDKRVEMGQTTAGQPGYPWHVVVQNGSTLNLQTGNVTSTQIIGGNLTVGLEGVGNGAITCNNITQDIRVNGDLIIGGATATGAVTLSSVTGADLEIQGSFTRNNTGTFTDNKREVVFFGTGNSSITAAAQDFAFLRINKSSGNLTLNCPVNITAPISGPDPQYRLSLESGLIHTTPTNLLTIGAVGVVAGGSPTSFVNGPMARITGANTGYIFPVGKGSTYKPMTFTVSANSGGSTFTGEYFATIAPFVNTDIYSPLIVGVQNNAYWDLASGGGSTTGTVTLPYAAPAANAWRPQAPGPPLDLTDCWYCNVVVVKREGTEWLPFNAISNTFSTGSPTETTNWATVGTTNVVSKVINSFSPFTFGVGINTILPITLLSFDGQWQGSIAQLRWQIADDKTLAGFELQHGTNGRDFRLLEKLGPAGTVYAAQHANLPGGTHFYRLKMTDKAGKVQYSRTVLLVKGAAQTTIVGLVQNPVQNQRALVELYSAKAQLVQLQVTDLTGRVVYRSAAQAAAGQQTLPVPLRLLLPGQYYLNIFTADGVQKTLPFLR